MSSSVSKRSLTLLFSGQGSQAKGFPLLSKLTENPQSNSWKLLQQIDEMYRSTFDCSLLAIMRDNPKVASLDGKKYFHETGLLGNTIFGQPAILAYQQACFEHFLEQLKISRREFLGEISASNNQNTNEKTKFDQILLAGHSLGEFSALASLCPHIFSSVSDAAELVTRRGLAMESALDSLGLPGRNTASSSTSNKPIMSHFVMIAINPTRAMLKEEELLLLVELVSEAVTIKLRRPHTLLELANDNIHQEQLVVAADRFSASVLGKCVDPQWRASCLQNEINTFGDLVQAAIYDADVDERAGVTKDPNAPPPKDFVPGSLILGGRANIGIPKFISADGGVTLPEERLTRLSNVGSGRSGLKKKVYFNQLPVEVPFHSSALRHAFDDLYGHVQKKVVASFPGQDQQSGVIFGGTSSSNKSVYPKLHWFPNITGTDFSAHQAFKKSLLETLSENVNVGEQAHHGKVVPKGLNEILAKLSSPTTERDLICSALTTQLCNVVCWSNTMDNVAQKISDEEDNIIKDAVIIEFAPSTSVLNEMMKKAHPEIIPKENYYLLPRDMEKCVKDFS